MNGRAAFVWSNEAFTETSSPCTNASSPPRDPTQDTARRGAVAPGAAVAEPVSGCWATFTVRGGAGQAFCRTFLSIPACAFPDGETGLLLWGRTTAEVARHVRHACQGHVPSVSPLLVLALAAWSSPCRFSSVT